MNFALPSLLLFFLFIGPGIFFRRFYYTLNFSKQFKANNSFNVFISSIFIGVFIHILFYVIINHLIPWVSTKEFTILMVSFDLIPWNVYNIDFDLFFDIIFPQKGKINDFYSNIIINNNFKEGVIFFYFLFLYIFSAFLGRLALWVVRKYKFDHYYKVFRFRNYWYYLFSGETLCFPDVKNRKENIKIINKKSILSKNNKHFEVETTFIDTVMLVGDEPTIYKGIFLDYYLNSEGDELESLCIGEAQRRKLHDSNIVYDGTMHSEGIWHKFESDVFTFPAKQIINMNLSYIAVPDYNIAVSILHTFYEILKEVNPQRINNWNEYFFSNKYYKGALYLDDMGALETIKRSIFRFKKIKIIVKKEVIETLVKRYDITKSD